MKVIPSLAPLTLVWARNMDILLYLALQFVLQLQKKFCQ